MRCIFIVRLPAWALSPLFCFVLYLVIFSLRILCRRVSVLALLYFFSLVIAALRLGSCFILALGVGCISLFVSPPRSFARPFVPPPPILLARCRSCIVPGVGTPLCSAC